MPCSRFSDSNSACGKALSGTIISTIQAAIILMLFPFLGLKLGLLAIPQTILVAILLSFCISALGIVIASFYESFESFSVIMNFIVMPMFFLSGAMYPVNKLPEILQFISRLNPLTYGIDALKHTILKDGGLFDFSMAADVGVLLATSLLFVITAGIMFERKK
ncbi:MAG: ABC transporter permease [Nitrospirae bacterium]|nr:ABC transporter permease [Nitrospirota bacterium]